MFIYVSEDTDDFQTDYKNSIDDKIVCLKQLNKHFEYCNISNTNIKYFYNLQSMMFYNFRRTIIFYNILLPLFIVRNNIDFTYISTSETENLSDRLEINIDEEYKYFSSLLKNAIVGDEIFISRFNQVGNYDFYLITKLIAEKILKNYYKVKIVKLPIIISNKAYCNCKFKQTVIDRMNHNNISLYNENGQFINEEDLFFAIKKNESLVSNIGKLDLEEFIKNYKNEYNIKQFDVTDVIFSNKEILNVFEEGSSSKIYVLKDKETEEVFVRKMAISNGINGNGIPKLKKEIKFLDYIKELPLGKLYPKLIQSAISEDYCYYDMEYIEGISLKDLLIGKGNKNIEEKYNELFNLLIDNGNIILVEENDNMINDFKNKYYKKVMDSFLVIEQHEELKNIIKKEYIVINKVKYKNIKKLFFDFFCKEDIIKRLAPKTLSFCVHGDFIASNIYFKDENIRLIDPRGDFENFDILYDFAKAKWSLDGYISLTDGRFNVIINSDENFCLKINNYSYTDSIDKMKKIYMSLLEKNQKFNEKIISFDKYWKERILFHESVHFLSNVIMRCHKDKNGQSALAELLLATKYFNELYNYMDRKEISDDYI